VSMYEQLAGRVLNAAGLLISPRALFHILLRSSVVLRRSSYAGNGFRALSARVLVCYAPRTSHKVVPTLQSKAKAINIFFVSAG
jgi:hypothetical protein